MTIVVDTSALVAVVPGEVEAESLLAAMQRHDCLVPAVSVVGAGIVVETRQGPDASRDLQLLLDATASAAPADAIRADAAVDAWQRYGTSRHPASLHVGDCFSYALARWLGHRLLFTGDDVAQTDIAPADA